MKYFYPHVSLKIMIIILHFNKITAEFSLFITSVTLVIRHDKHELHIISRTIWLFVLKVVINCAFFLYDYHLCQANVPANIFSDVTYVTSIRISPNIPDILR